MAKGRNLKYILTLLKSSTESSSLEWLKFLDCSCFIASIHGLLPNATRLPWSMVDDDNDGTNFWSKYAPALFIIIICSLSLPWRRTPLTTIWCLISQSAFPFPSSRSSFILSFEQTLQKTCCTPVWKLYTSMVVSRILLFLYKNKSESSDVGGGGGGVGHMPQSESLKQVINRKAWWESPHKSWKDGELWTWVSLDPKDHLEL